MLEGETAQSFI